MTCERVSLNAAKMTKYSYSSLMTPTVRHHVDSYVEWLEALSLLGLRIHAPVHLVTYLLTYIE